MPRYYYVRQHPQDSVTHRVRADEAQLEETAYLGEDGPTGTTRLSLYLDGAIVAQFSGDAMSWVPHEETEMS